MHDALLLLPHPHPPHTCTQLIVHVMYKEVTFANNFMDFVTGFNITIETLKKFFPEKSHRLDDFFYDAKSMAEAYLSKLSIVLFPDPNLHARKESLVTFECFFG